MSAAEEHRDLPVRDPGVPRFARMIMAVAVVGAMWILLRPEADGPPGTGGFRPGAPEDASSAGPSGASLFFAQGCGACHSTIGPATAMAPTLAGVWDRAAARIAEDEYRGSANTREDYLREAVLDPCAYVVLGYTCTCAPDVGLRLSSAEVDRLVTYLAGLSAGGGR